MIKCDDPIKASALFAGWQETMITSCLQNVMGEIFVDHLENPTTALALIGDFAFLAGAAKKEFLLNRSQSFHQDFVIMVPQDEKWAQLIEQCYPKARQVERYATKKETDIFDFNHLQNIIKTLPSHYSIQSIDRHIYHQCQQSEYFHDLVSLYPTYDDFLRLGLGFVIMHHQDIVSGASSYTRYLEGIEVQINTHPQYLRQSLATIVGAKLILECLFKGLYPSWDAQNKGSLALVQKLGYHYSHTYIAYEVKSYGKKKESFKNI